MLRTALRWIVGASSSILMVAAQAHHSFRAQYDSEKPIEVTGYVTKIDWMNPHVYFHIDVVNAQGKTESWAFEMGPPHMLEQRGWKRNSMAIGDELVVSGTRARDGSFTANARTVKLKATGQVLGAASSEGQTITQGAPAR
jgi:lipopolysaccharide export system protein LptA